MLPFTITFPNKTVKHALNRNFARTTLFENVFKVFYFSLPKNDKEKLKFLLFNCFLKRNMAPFSE